MPAPGRSAFRPSRGSANDDAVDLVARPQRIGLDLDRVGAERQTAHLERSPVVVDRHLLRQAAVDGDACDGTAPKGAEPREVGAGERVREGRVNPAGAVDRVLEQMVASRDICVP